jgi:hypothetical protein
MPGPENSVKTKYREYFSFKRESLARYLITGIFRETFPYRYQTLSEAAHKKIIRENFRDIQGNTERIGCKVILSGRG